MFSSIPSQILPNFQLQIHSSLHSSSSISNQFHFRSFFVRFKSNSGFQLVFVFVTFLREVFGFVKPVIFRLYPLVRSFIWFFPCFRFLLNQIREPKNRYISVFFRFCGFVFVAVFSVFRFSIYRYIERF